MSAIAAESKNTVLKCPYEVAYTSHLVPFDLVI